MERILKSSRRWLYLKEIYPFITKNKKIALLIITFKLSTILVMLFSPLIYRYFINNVIIAGNLHNLVFVAASYVLLYLAQSFFQVYFTLVDNRFKNLLHIDLRKRLLNFYFLVPMEDYNKMDKEDIRNIIEEDSQKLQELFSESVNVILSVGNVFLLHIIMVAIDWRLTLFGLLMILCSFGLTRFVGDKVKNVSRQYREGVGELDGLIHHLLQNWKEIKGNNLERQAEEEVSLKWQEISEYTIKRTFFEYIAGALAVLNLLVITRASLYFFGGILIFKGLTTVATMLVFKNYYQQINSEMTNLTSLIIKFKSDENQIERVIDILNRKIVKKQDILVEGDIALKNVNFFYDDPSKIILNNINMVIPAKSHVAIVGKSGSGKSTLAKLLLGVMPPKQGKIYIAKKEITNVSEQAINKVISAVMQEPQFFNISIAENLRLVQKDASTAELDRVCRQANIYDFIQTLPDGYNTVIGERGVKLSGGQRQRLAIARVLLADPDIIIFDEATSSLDNENEKEIVKVIQSISQNKTIITIAHRLTTILDADYIFLLKDGTVAAEGETEAMLHNREVKRLFQIK